MAEPIVTAPPVVEVPHEIVENLDSSGNITKSDGVQRLDALFSAAEKGAGIKAAIEAQSEPPVPAKAKEPAPAKETPPPAKPAESSDLDKRMTEQQNAKQAVETKKVDDAREALRKATETKAVETKPAEAKTTETKTDDDEVAEEELGVLPHDKPKTAKRIQAILKRAEQANAVVATTKAELDAKAKRLAELESELGKVKAVDPLQDERVKAQLDELAQYRRRYDIEKDPDFQSKFVGREQTAEQSITQLLKAKGAQDWLLNTIKEEGGWLKFTQSNKPITLTTADGDSTVSAAQFAEQIMNQLPFADRKALEVSTMEQIQLARERTRYMDENTKKAAEYFKQKEEEQVKSSAAYQKQLEEANKQIEAWQQEEFTKQEYLKLKEIPPDATPEEKAAIEDDNNYTRQLQSLHKKVIKTSDLPGLLEVAHDAVAYWAERRNAQRLSERLTKVETELQAKKAELDNYRKASRSVSRTGSIAGGSSTPDGAAKKAPRTLEETLDALERGEKPVSEE